jgi:hypothetical protein
MRSRVFFVACAAAAVGCQIIAGLGDPLSPPAAPLDASSEAAPSGDGSNGGVADAGTCDADLTKDPRNCGRCGHDCLGGECAESTCKPTDFAESATEIDDLVARDGYVYWANGGVVRRAEVGGAPTEEIVRDNQSHVIEVDSKYVYVAHRSGGTQVERAARDVSGQSPGAFVTLPGAHALAVDGDKLVVATGTSPARIAAFDPSGAALSPLLADAGDGTSINYLVGLNANWWFAMNGGVYRVAKAGGGFNEIVPSSFPIAENHARLGAYANGVVVRRDQTVTTIAEATGATTVVHAGDYPESATADADWVYIVLRGGPNIPDALGSVIKVRPDVKNGPAIVLDEHIAPEDSNNRSTAIAVSNLAVYYVVRKTVDQSAPVIIRRVAK